MQRYAWLVFRRALLSQTRILCRGVSFIFATFLSLFFNFEMTKMMTHKIIVFCFLISCLFYKKEIYSLPPEIFKFHFWARQTNRQTKERTEFLVIHYKCWMAVLESLGNLIHFWPSRPERTYVTCPHQGTNLFACMGKGEGGKKHFISYILYNSSWRKSSKKIIVDDLFGFCPLTNQLPVYVVFAGVTSFLFRNSKFEINIVHPR